MSSFLSGEEICHCRDESRPLKDWGKGIFAGGCIEFTPLLSVNLLLILSNSFPIVSLQIIFLTTNPFTIVVFTISWRLGGSVNFLMMAIIPGTFSMIYLLFLKKLSHLYFIRLNGQNIISRL
jgi:hypothetical protein